MMRPRSRSWWGFSRMIRVPLKEPEMLRKTLYILLSALVLLLILWILLTGLACRRGRMFRIGHSRTPGMIVWVAQPSAPNGS
jgi:hypothetical protein